VGGAPGSPPSARTMIRCSRAPRIARRSTSWCVH
jgi:hypothetical protein